MDNNISLGQGFLITIFSMAIVFLVLLGISFLIDVLRRAVAEDKPKLEESKKLEEKAVAVEESPAKKEEVDLEDEHELVAVIAAALACSMGVELPDINIKSIKRVNSNDTSWQNVARREQVFKNI